MMFRAVPFFLWLFLYGAVVLAILFRFLIPQLIFLCWLLVVSFLEGFGTGFDGVRRGSGIDRTLTQYSSGLCIKRVNFYVSCMSYMNCGNPENWFDFLVRCWVVWDCAYFSEE